MAEDEKGDGMGQMIRNDETRIRDYLGKMVRGTVEEMLNALLDAEAGCLCCAGRYERTEDRIGGALSYYAFPDSHWIKIRTNNPLERIIKEIRRRTKVVGAANGRPGST